MRFFILISGFFFLFIEDSVDDCTSSFIAGQNNTEIAQGGGEAPASEAEVVALVNKSEYYFDEIKNVSIWLLMRDIN